jgi:glucose/arabinose dehydrogenase
MRVCVFALAVAGAVVAMGGSEAFAAKGPPPLPKATGGQKVTVVARGVPTPTAFAFLGGQTFVSGFGDEEHPKITGGVYLLKGGKPTKVPGSPPHVFGLTTSGSTLYVSDGRQILAWSGWNGTRFAKSKVVATGPKRFSGFNGIFAVPGDKLYTGVSLSNGKKADYAHGITPYANDVLSVDTATGEIHVVAKGFRQPWQFASLPGQKNPVVSDLGQDNLKKASTDTIKIVVPGSNTGFPNCPATPSACSKYAKPFAKFPAHASPMGLGTIGNTLYAALFGGTGKGPEVVSIPAAGGKYTPLLTGFVAPVVALSTHDGAVYVGDLTGAVYSVKP